MHDAVKHLAKTLEEAYHNKQAIQIIGGNSKSFYGNQIHAKTISSAELTGIIEYEPTELFITAQAGTPLSEVENLLAQHNQMLSFEPPTYSPSATIGGTVACGLSGPRRPYADAIRDCILGTHIINGKGEHLIFGGKVIKNVAGYDVSRLMCGAFGTLGLLTQISIKVLPKPQCEITLMFEFTEQQARKQLNDWLTQLIPISASYFHGNQLWIRLSGLGRTLDKIKSEVGGQQMTNSEAFWTSLKNHQTDFFMDDTPLWRCIIPHNTSEILIDGERCFEWNGGLHWIKSEASEQQIFDQCSSLRGHASLFRHFADNKPSDCFSPMNTQLKQLHLNLKRAFDPAGILNPGRMYSWC